MARVLSLRPHERLEPEPVIERQSRIDSFMETLTNTAIGFLVAMIGNALILPWIFGIEVSMGANILTATAYTVISIIRQFTLRRMFNGRSVWQAMRARWAGNS